MAEQTIFSLIPESLKEDLIKEVQDILEQRKNQKSSQPDVDLVNYARKKNEQALKSKTKKP